MPAGIVLSDPDGRCLYANKRACRLTGYSAQELMAGAWMCHPDDADAFETYRRSITAGISGDNHETRYIRKDGSVMWASLSWRATLDRDGKVRLLHTIFTDVTGHKQAELALRESEERYKRIVDNTHDLVMINNPDMTISFLSPACKRILGYDPEELVGTKPSVTHPDDADIVYAAADRAFKGESGTDCEYRVITKSGEIKWTSHSWSPVMADGKLQMVVSLIRDITEDKRSQEALAAAEEKYRLLAENASDIIWQMDMHGIFTYVSGAVREFGYDPAEWLGHSILDFLPDHKKTATEQRMKKDIEARHHQRYEVQMKRKDSSLIWMEVSVDIIMDGSKPIRIQGIARDISLRKADDEALRKAHEDLARAYDIQREFLNNVTHEVRTPLTAVQGYVQMLLEGTFGPVSDEQASLLRKVLASSDHLLSMVGEILEMARLKSGTLALRSRACNPCRLINKAVSIVMPQAMQRGIELIVRMPEQDLLGMYDEEKLTAILTNLLSNAVKFTEKGEVEVIVACKNSHLEVIVADSGMGIRRSDMNSIFDEFQQLDYPHKHKPTGFGLGLAIVATMVEMIGASLAVSSRKGYGTAFTLFVPTLEAQ